MPVGYGYLKSMPRLYEVCVTSFKVVLNLCHIIYLVWTPNLSVIRSLERELRLVFMLHVHPETMLERLISSGAYV